MAEIDYYKRKEISHSDLKRIAISMKSFMTKTEQTEPMKFGSLFHSYVLERDKFAKENLIKEYNLTTKVGKELIANTTKNVIKTKEFRTMYLMNESIKSLPSNPIIFSGNYEVEKELLFEYKDVKCRSKLDYVNHDNKYFLDVKTIADITKCENTAKYDYLTQMYFYKVALFENYGIDYIPYLVFVEKQSPYNSVVIEVSDLSLFTFAENWILEQIEKYKKWINGNELFNHYKQGYIEL